ncbi:hypothetical protein BQ8482_180185 [Mesorhizobium delmotii]|uniref:Uncharacterized protein n=1 Tax=Mesorhizobium delmotii TaxID=1631247 RepID=A0A2P9AIJ2_9HYPH|nr:hypothetical protein BQ8482_180185 [Mesorhizobium delmotii]
MLHSWPACSAFEIIRRRFPRALPRLSASLAVNTVLRNSLEEPADDNDNGDETTHDQWRAAAANREATINKAIKAANVAPHWSSFPKHGYRDVRLGCRGWGD